MPQCAKADCLQSYQIIGSSWYKFGQLGAVVFVTFFPHTSWQLGKVKGPQPFPCKNRVKRPMLSDFFLQQQQQRSCRQSGSASFSICVRGQFEFEYVCLSPRLSFSSIPLRFFCATRIPKLIVGEKNKNLVPSSIPYSLQMFGAILMLN